MSRLSSRRPRMGRKIGSQVSRPSGWIRRRGPECETLPVRILDPVHDLMVAGWRGGIAGEVAVCSFGRRETGELRMRRPLRGERIERHAGIARGNPAVANAGISENRRRTFSSIREMLLS
jgi:hypothetical protein